MAKLKDTHGGHHGAGRLPNVMDPGAVGCGYLEADVAHRINELIRKYTGAPDTSDYAAVSVPQNLSNIVSNMNRYAGDWHISNHLNAFNGTANGVEVWYYAGDAVAGEMAAKVSAAISKATGLFNRGAKATTNLYVISNSIGRTLLIEWAFIDNQGDMNKLMPNLDNAVKAMLGCFDYNVSASPVAVPPAAKPNPVVGNLELVNTNNMATNISGWLGNSEKSITGEPWVFILDTNEKEIARYKATKVHRPDVNKAFKNIPADNGLTVTFSTPDHLKGREFKVMFRLASDAKGDKSNLDKYFDGKFKFKPKLNAGNLDLAIPIINEMAIQGWHFSDKVYDGVYSYLILLDASTNKELDRINITAGSFNQSNDVAKVYPGYLASKCRFSYKGLIPDKAKGKAFKIIHRYAKSSDGENSISDYHYNNIIK